MRLAHRFQAGAEIADRQAALGFRQRRGQLVRRQDGVRAHAGGAVERGGQLRVGVVEHQLRRRVADPGCAVDRLQQPLELAAAAAHRGEVTRADRLQLGAVRTPREGVLRPALLLGDGPQRIRVALGRGRAVDAPSGGEQDGERESAHAHSFCGRAPGASREQHLRRAAVAFGHALG